MQARGSRCLHSFPAVAAAAAAAAHAGPVLASTHPPPSPPTQPASNTISSITELLDALPRHFSSLAPTAAAAGQAVEVAEMLIRQVEADAAGCASSTVGAALER